MQGDTDKNAILLPFQSDELSEAFLEIHKSLCNAGIEPKHTIQNSSKWKYGFTPHFTLARFSNPEDASKALESVRGTWMGTTFYLDNFHLFADSENGATVLVE